MRPYLALIDSTIPTPTPAPPASGRWVLILHDQLNRECWKPYLDRSDGTQFLFIESREKGKELPHHKKKAVFILSAMRHFALELHRDGHSVRYLSTRGHFDRPLRRLLASDPAPELVIMEPSEWDTRDRLRQLEADHPGRITWIPNRFFMADIPEWTPRIKPGFRMEVFYREMRRRTGLLMEPDGTTPLGGRWNYDEENRKALPKGMAVPPVTRFDPDEVTREVMDLVEAEFPEGMGDAEGFGYAVTRDQALRLAEEFVRDRLGLFGPFEDAMAAGKPVLFHSQLSIYLNAGLLLPVELCGMAAEAHRRGEVPIESAEGFIRQIIGWREYVRIYYEAMMPAVRDANHFGFTEPLPELYWTGRTDLRCLAECVRPVLEQAWSHHIPRLMVLSNFSNLTRTDPRELHRWFLLAYADAYEWVELPNVLGMSTFADGGVLASKPYVAGGAYIHRMSDYCKGCRYDVRLKTGPDACPFNYLYWNFVDEQRGTFTGSGRVHFMVKSFDNKSAEERQAIRESSARFLEGLDRPPVT